MLRMVRPRKSRQMENTIALINIVFLMLIFFLIAGTIAPSVAPEVSAVKTSKAEATEPDEMLGLRADGTLIHRGEVTTPEAYAEWLKAGASGNGAEPEIRLLPDRELPADKLLETVSDLSAASGARIVIISERARP